MIVVVLLLQLLMISPMLRPSAISIDTMISRDSEAQEMLLQRQSSTGKSSVSLRVETETALQSSPINKPLAILISMLTSPNYLELTLSKPESIGMRRDTKRAETTSVLVLMSLNSALRKVKTAVAQELFISLTSSMFFKKESPPQDLKLPLSRSLCNLA